MRTFCISRPTEGVLTQPSMAWSAGTLWLWILPGSSVCNGRGGRFHQDELCLCLLLYHGSNIYDCIYPGHPRSNAQMVR